MVLGASNCYNNTNAVKTLILLWVPKTDHFCIKVKLNQLQSLLKRALTSRLAKLFNPLGLLVPVIIKVKIIVQKLWQLNMDRVCFPKILMQHGIHSEMTYTTKQILKFLSIFSTVKFRQKHRFTCLQMHPSQFLKQLHTFAQSSSINDETVGLLCLKTWVGSLKQPTIPRLELYAAVMAAQLAHRIKMKLNLQNHPVFLWVHPEIVVVWVNAQSSSFKTFLANRIAIIQFLTVTHQWRHVKYK